MEDHLSDIKSNSGSIISKHPFSDSASSPDSTNKTHSLPQELTFKIKNFLLDLPHARDEETFQTLCTEAGFDQQLRAQLNLHGSATRMVHELLSTIAQYGDLQDGRNPYQELLNAAKNRVGSNKAEECDRLIEELHNLSEKG